MLLQILANALALGAAYALLALGFVLILNATSAVNFARICSSTRRPACPRQS